MNRPGDALVRLNFPFGGYLDGISMWSPSRQGNGGGKTRVIGEAITVKASRRILFQAHT